MTNTESQGAGEKYWKQKYDELHEEFVFLNIRKEEKLRDNLMQALGHTKDDGHNYTQHELGQFLEDIFYHYRDELPAAARELSSLRETVRLQRIGLEDAAVHMERARAILHEGGGNWGMLDTTRVRDLLNLTSPEEVNQHEPSA